jgi:hypothetical protein
MSYTIKPDDQHTDAGHISGYDPACPACNKPKPLAGLHLAESLFCDVGSNAGKYRVTLKGYVSHAELSALQRSVAQQVSDKITLDAIATVMSNEEWNADTADLIAGLIRESGREVKEL